jgi:hypothetical protein
LSRADGSTGFIGNVPMSGLRLVKLSSECDEEWGKEKSR